MSAATEPPLSPLGRHGITADDSTVTAGDGKRHNGRHSLPTHSQKRPTHVEVEMGDIDEKAGGDSPQRSGHRRKFSTATGAASRRNLGVADLFDNSSRHSRNESSVSGSPNPSPLPSPHSPSVRSTAGRSQLELQDTVPTVLRSNRTIHCADSDDEPATDWTGKPKQERFEATVVTEEVDPKAERSRSRRLRSSVAQQFVSFSEVKHFFSYAAYLYSARIRFAYFFILALALAFAGMLGFVFEVFFSVLLPQTRDNEYWAFRAAFMLPMAPVILVGGSWFCAHMLLLIADAASENQLRGLRMRIAALAHSIEHRDTLPALDIDAVISGSASYKGPPVRRRTMAFVDLLVPIALEVLPLIGFLTDAIQTQTLVGAVGGYFKWGIFAAGGMGAVSVLLVVVMTRWGTMLAVFQWLHRISPLSTPIWIIPEVSQRLQVRVMNLGRHLLPDNAWGKDLEEAADLVTGDDTRCDQLRKRCSSCFATLHRFQQTFKEEVPWLFRFVLDVVLFFLVAMLAAFNVLDFGLAWFLLSLLIHAMGMMLREVLGPAAVTPAFSAFLTFFTVFGGLLFIFSALNLQPSSTLNILPPPSTVTDASSIQLSPISNLTAGYPVCRQLWMGLDVIDFAILANLAYAPTDSGSFATKMTNAFNGTAMQDWSLIYSEPSGEPIHFKDIYFPSTGLTVVTVRGTSTAEEVYQDAHIYSSISLLQFINTFVPVQGILPDSLIVDFLFAMSLPNLSGPAAYQSVLDHVTGLIAAGRTVILTGHSLGGALSGITAASLGVPAVAFSPPGLYFVHEQVEITDRGLRQWVTSIVPENDVVPKADRQMGNIQRINCDQGVATCHSIDVTLCELYRACGDRRKRDWNTYCDDFT